MNKLIKINIDNEKLNLNVVNCVEIGICYCLDIYGRDYRQYFLLLLKLIQSYKTPGFSNQNIIYPVNIHKYMQLLLNEKLKVKINFYNYSEDGFYGLIEGLIEKRKPVLVTGNLKELYYSRNYKERDARHIVLINGYEKQKEIFRIINGEHCYIRNKPIYQQFVIPYQALKDMYESFGAAFGDPFICDFELIENKFEKASILNECLSLYLNSNTGNEKYREIIYIDQIIRKISKEADCSNLDETFLRTVKYKDMFYTILASSIAEVFGKDKSAQNVMSLKEKMVSLWEDICNTCLLGLYKNEMFNIERRLKEVLALEKEMESELTILK